MDLQLSEEITEATPDWPANEKKKKNKGEGKAKRKANVISLI